MVRMRKDSFGRKEGRKEGKKEGRKEGKKGKVRPLVVIGHCCYRGEDDVGVSHDSSLLYRLVDAFHSSILEGR